MGKPIQTYVLEGDWGGALYLTVPVALVGSRARLDELLDRLNKAYWSGENEGTRVRTLDVDPGDAEAEYPVFDNAAWVHPDLAHLEDLVRTLLALRKDVPVRHEA